MELFLDEQDDYIAVLATLHQAYDDPVSCRSRAVFDLAKSVIVKERLIGVTLRLLDENDLLIKQISSKKKNQNRAGEIALSDRQMAVIRALEKVLDHCRREGIQLIGYSDELVAIPAGLAPDEAASTSAIDVQSYDVYLGADNFLDET